MLNRRARPKLCSTTCGLHKAQGEPCGESGLCKRGVHTALNHSTFKPTHTQILERYIIKFSQGGKAKASEMHQDDLGLLDPEGGDGEEVLVQADTS